MPIQFDTGVRSKEQLQTTPVKIRSLFSVFAMLLFSLSNICLGQEKSLIEKLESSNIDAKKGQVDTDINPEDVIHWKIAGQDYDVATKKLSISFALTTERFTIYQDKLKFEANDGWKLTIKSTPETNKQYDEIEKKDVNVYSEGIFEVVLDKVGNPEQAIVNITYVGCTGVICLFPHTKKMSIPWTPVVEPTNGSAPVAATSESSAATFGNQSANSPAKGTVEEQFAQKVKAGQMGIAMLLLIAFLGGLVTNLTPCVAPMIPITIRLLGNQTAKPLTSAIMYASGIVATYTSLGMVAALSGALFGNLIAHPAVSITFGVVMFVLGLSMLGFGDFSKLQQIGGRIGSSKGGPLNSFLMGAGAGLVASPCTGPILAALLTYTAGRQNTLEAIALLGVYSIGFALPYVFLGASAAKISQKRVSFKVQIITKLVFASVMFALSLYFMRLPLYGLFTTIKAYWSIIGIIGCIWGVALSVIVILKQSLQHHKYFFLAPTIAFGIGIFFGIQALTRETSGEVKGIQWLHTEKEALDSAAKTGKPILVDAWAEWCEACKKMDSTTFKDPKVIEEITNHWTPLKFDLTEINDENNEIQDRYELPGLPTLTLLPSSGDLKAKQAITGYASSELLLDSLNKFKTGKPILEEKAETP